MNSTQLVVIGAGPGGYAAAFLAADLGMEVAIVEKETDLISLEKTGKFRGQYLVLGGLAKNGELNPNQRLRLKSLAERIKKELNGQVKEIIIGLSPTTFGDFTGSLTP